MKKIVGIDIGHNNLGIVRGVVGVAVGSEMRSEIICDYCNLINLSQHIHCINPKCIFQQSERFVSHLLYHFLEDFAPLFEESDVILIEQQPTIGLTHIEQTLYMYFKLNYTLKHKKIVKLIHPRSIHSMFKISDDYDERKQQVEAFAQPYLQDFECWQKRGRKHDMADAFVLIKYYVEKEKTEKKKKMSLNHINIV